MAPAGGAPTARRTQRLAALCLLLLGAARAQPAASQTQVPVRLVLAANPATQAHYQCGQLQLFTAFLTYAQNPNGALPLGTVTFSMADMKHAQVAALGEVEVVTLGPDTYAAWQKPLRLVPGDYRVVAKFHSADANYASSLPDTIDFQVAVDCLGAQAKAALGR